MASRIIKESNVRAIFKNRQMTQGALDWLDEYVEGMLQGAYEKIKGVKQGRWNPRIDEEMLEFSLMPNGIIVLNGGGDDDEDEEDQE